MGQLQHLHPDGLQWIFLGVCLFDMVFFTYYLFAYDLQDQHTISDSLFSHADYASILSITLTTRLLAVALFLLRYKHEAWGWMVQGYSGVFLTALGW